jgi:hypothetical protein
MKAKAGINVEAFRCRGRVKANPKAKPAFCFRVRTDLHSPAAVRRVEFWSRRTGKFLGWMKGFCELTKEMSEGRVPGWIPNPEWTVRECLEIAAGQWGNPKDRKLAREFVNALEKAH